MARLAQSAERKALNLVVVGSSPTVGATVRTGEHSVRLRETLGGCTRLTWGRNGVPQKMSIHCIHIINWKSARRCGKSLSIDKLGGPHQAQASPRVHQVDLGEKWRAPKNANPLYNKNNLNIRRESVGNLCRLYKLGGLHQTRAAHRHKQTRHTRRHKGSAREPQGTGSKGTSPTAKLRLNKNNVCARRVTQGGAPHTTADSAYMFETGCRTNLCGIAAHIGWPTAIGCWK